MKQNRQTYWIPLADMMTGLMMVFLLISMVYMSKTASLITEFDGTKKEIEKDLKSGLDDDLKKFNAEILSDLTIRFKDTSTIFSIGSSKINQHFAEQLKVFVPKYIAIVSQEKYKKIIKEIRIEGHTSNVWAGTNDKKIAYINNMDLSQDRTRETLRFILSMPELQSQEDFLYEKLTAIGFSSSRPILNDDQTINTNASQRIEFRIVTNSDDTIKKIKNEIIVEKNQISNNIQ